MLMLLSSKSKVFLLVSRKSYPDPSLIQFRLKGNINSNQYLKGLFNVVPCQLFQEIRLKSKNVVSSRLSFQ